MRFPIATKPASPRDHCRLCVIERTTRRWTHRRFFDVKEYLSAGDVLVLNTSRVIEARVPFSVDGVDYDILLTAIPTKRVPVRAKLEGRAIKALKRSAGKATFAGGRVGALEVLDFDETDKTFSVRADLPAELSLLGEMPLPPYIARARKLAGESRVSASDAEAYQNVYAQHRGSIAAPTAGLHWTPELLDQVAAQGVDVAKVVLHIGVASIMDVTAKDSVPAEWYWVPDAAGVSIAAAKRVVACGTSCVRTLENWALTGAREAAADIFIRPGHRFAKVGALLTNFHLPDSTHFALTQAFLGDGLELGKIYEDCVDHDYKFYSYGDAMLIV
ncbi:MAG: S-adenosylmethionine:tRNA ribosyltransferase-isomerase, partial [Elusimicrobiota bacterium]